MKTFTNLQQALHAAFKRHSTQVWIEYMCGNLATEKLCQGIYQAIGDFQIVQPNTGKITFSSARDAAVETTVKEENKKLIIVDNQIKEY